MLSADFFLYLLQHSPDIIKAVAVSHERGCHLAVAVFIVELRHILLFYQLSEPFPVAVSVGLQGLVYQALWQTLLLQQLKHLV